MTLILVLANRDQVIQLSDRRLTVGQQTVDEEHGKSGTLVSSDGRFTFGFSGLARTPHIEIRRWLMDAFSKVAPPDATAHGAFTRLAELATHDFQTHPALQALPVKDKLTAFMFTGYLYREDPPAVGAAFVTNRVKPHPGSQFIAHFVSEVRPRVENFTYVQALGANQALRQPDIDVLRLLLDARKPAKAIIGKATEILLDVADRPGSGGRIGKQIDWLRIPSSLDEGMESGSYSNVVSYTVYIPAFVVLTPNGAAGAMDASMTVVKADNGNAHPLNVPKVGRNARCPCGSGQRYKRCHGEGPSRRLRRRQRRPSS